MEEHFPHSIISLLKYRKPSKSETEPKIKQINQALLH